LSKLSIVLFGLLAALLQAREDGHCCFFCLLRSVFPSVFDSRRRKEADYSVTRSDPIELYQAVR
jgi:hypothetical protein